VDVADSGQDVYSVVKVGVSFGDGVAYDFDNDLTGCLVCEHDFFFDRSRRGSLIALTTTWVQGQSVMVKVVA